MSPVYLLLIRSGSTDSTSISIFHLLSAFPISISAMGENFSILLFLALSSLPWAPDKALPYRPYLCIMEIGCNITGNSRQCTSRPSRVQSLKTQLAPVRSHYTFSPSYLWVTAPPRCRCRDPPWTWAHCRLCPGPWWQTPTPVPEGRRRARPGPEPEVCKKPSSRGPVSRWHGCLPFARRWWRWSLPLLQRWCTWCCHRRHPSLYGSVNWNKIWVKFPFF